MRVRAPLLAPLDNDSVDDKNASMQVGAANVLMVGAGGIGCELIKTLVLTGFRKITMVRISAPFVRMFPSLDTRNPL